MTRKQKHHYIPVFYLKQWAGEDGRLCEYSRPYKDVKPHRRHPDETAFERGLYTLATYPSPVAEIIENVLMKGVDDLAARALQIILDGSFGALDNVLRMAWARFIISLMRRSPESVRDVAQQLRNLEANPANADPKIQDTRIERQKALLLNSTINNQRNIMRLADMTWAVTSFEGQDHTLLTSDRPYVMTNSIGYPNSHIAVPISPTQCFVAAATREEMKKIQTIPPKTILTEMNNRMALQARRFVYGVDDSQLRFVTKRFGAKRLAGPGDVR